MSKMLVNSTPEKKEPKSIFRKSEQNTSKTVHYVVESED
jgi:hypothetical protein